MKTKKTMSGSHCMMLDIGKLYANNPTDNGLEKVLDMVRQAWSNEEQIQMKIAEDKRKSAEKRAAAEALYANFLGFFQQYYPEDYKSLVADYSFEEFYEDLDA